MGVSNPISSTERPVAQIIRTYVGETTGSDTEDRREIPKMTTLRSNMGWTVDHSGQSNALAFPIDSNAIFPDFNLVFHTRPNIC